MSGRNRTRGQKQGRKIAKAVAVTPQADTVPTVTDGPRLLSSAAAALAALEAAGITVRLAHGAVITEAGYVFRIGGQWAARALTLTEFPAGTGDD